MNFIGQEVFFDRDDLIVSKTDLDGRLTYVNHTFMEVSNYEEHELIGKQHNVIRHPNMPRAVFEMLWSTIKSGNEIFAYVVNSTKSGDHYWVNAHVTPSFRGGAIVGYHSTRRVPSAATITGKIIPLYDEMLAIEASNSSKKEGLQQSVTNFKAKLADLEMNYDEFVADLKKDD